MLWPAAHMCLCEQRGAAAQQASRIARRDLPTLLHSLGFNPTASCLRSLLEEACTAAAPRASETLLCFELLFLLAMMMMYSLQSSGAAL